MGIQFRYVILFAILILLINLAYETWIPILNTPDFVDAWYGVAGVGLAIVELYAIKRCGLSPS